MIRNKSVLEVKSGERIYSLEVYTDSPLGEVFDVLSQMRGYIVQRMIDEQNKDKPKEKV
jgi:hypothetical protein